MEQTSILEQRLDRILTSVSLEKPDRTPVVLLYTGFAAQVTGTPMAEFVGSLATATDTMIQAYDLIGDGDAVNTGTFSPYGLCPAFGAQVRVPGLELSDDEMWQVVETELMVREDYDRILEMGWPDYFQDFMKNRILKDVPPERLPWGRNPGDIKGKWAARGVPVLSGDTVTTPIELLCGSRSLTSFCMDLFDIPVMVEKVMDEMVSHMADRACRRAKKLGYPGVWVGGWRAAPSMLSPTHWERFAWPYFKELACQVADTGLIPILHLDSDWTRELERFRELPKGKCILSTDGETDLFKAKEVLGDHMCLMGDLPAVMQMMSSPDEVYEYCQNLIRKLGPEGFILHSGCDIAPNAKLENIQAMVAAATGR
ncbi:MAG: uroporphyrinogen decarboxylase [Desulfobacterales bacterium]|nr:uroporphyrinogen decarboxylase [Desulfobacterales bacterium]